MYNSEIRLGEILLRDPTLSTVSPGCPCLVLLVHDLHMQRPCKPAGWQEEEGEEEKSKMGEKSEAGQGDKKHGLA